MIKNPKKPQLKVAEVSKPYFHEASQRVIDKLIKLDVSWQEVMQQYNQPDWCKYQEALSGKLGCWSLTDIEKNGLRTKISKEFCKNCPECTLYGC